MQPQGKVNCIGIVTTNFWVCIPDYSNNWVKISTRYFRSNEEFMETLYYFWV